MKRILHFSLPIISLAALIAVVYFVPPPKDWQTASIWQILGIFIPILAFIISFSNLFRPLAKSSIIGLGSIVVIILQLLHLLTPISGLIVVLITIILVKMIPRSGKNKDLTDNIKIPKLTRIGDKHK